MLSVVGWVRPRSQKTTLDCCPRVRLTLCVSEPVDELRSDTIGGPYNNNNNNKNWEKYEALVSNQNIYYTKRNAIFWTAKCVDL